MCEKCNETLLVAAQAARDLANAASTLYHINQQNEAEILAKAAAALFEEPKVDPVKPNAGSGEVNAQEETYLERTLRELNESLPEGVTITKDGAFVRNGKIIGQVVLVSR